MAENSLLPRELTPAIADVLGLMPWVTGRIAGVYRAAGHDIPTKCEAEQAFVMHRCLHLAIEHGDGWRVAAQAELDELKARLQPKAD